MTLVSPKASLSCLCVIVVSEKSVSLSAAYEKRAALSVSEVCPLQLSLQKRHFFKV
jgi:hypothetical protein